MSEYVTDPEILKKLQGSSAPAESEYVTDPAILKQLQGSAAIGETAKPPEGSIEGTAAQTAAGAVGMNVGATGLTELGQAGMQAAKPFAQAAAGPTAAIYRAHPLLAPAVDALGMATVGVPPVAASQSVMGLYDKYKGAVEGAKEVSKFTSQGAPGVSGKPVTIESYYELRDALRKAGGGDIYDDVMKAAHAQGGAGNNAVIAGLKNNPKFQSLVASNPEVAAAAESYMGKVPGVMGQVGRVAGPILRGAAKVAGPIGMGMNLYDAGQMARETQLGERLAQGQGQMAENAFRAGPVQNYQGPQLGAQEAQNVLQSGSARDIKYFGGEDRLTQLMRRKAAEKVLGPVVPGSF